MSGDFLAQMMAAARERVAQAQRESPLSRPASTPAHAGRLRAALADPRSGGIVLIAEVKRSSPSKGVIDGGLDAREQACAYEAAGADAISVLTEPTRFGGSLDDLAQVSAAVSLPVLRKDFIVDRYQLWEAAESGAAAVLLIVAALPGDRLTVLLEEAALCRLDALVEVHDEAEVDRALDSGATLIGANNRDLHTLTVDPGVTARVAARLGDRLGDPTGGPLGDRLRDHPVGARSGRVLLVSESGIGDAEDAARAARAGASALLVGEALVRAARADLPRLVAELKGATWREGVMTADDVRATANDRVTAVKEGAGS